MIGQPTQAGSDPRSYRGLRGLRALWGCLAVSVVVAFGSAPAAMGGEWVEASCVNPDGSAAGSASWVSMIAGGGYGSNSSTVCGPGAPMFAILSSDAAVGVGSAETLHYIPPAGSTLDGGVIDVSMFADGRGYDASGTAVAYTPEYAYNGSSVFFQCASGLPPCANGSYDFSGALAIPGGRGGNLYLSAGCGGAPGASCQEGGSNGAWSLVQLWWANLRLTNSATPTAGGVGGTLLEPGAREGRELTLTATDTEGPGVYRASVVVDGQTLYDATPDSNGGRCVPAGSSGGALMFDSSQPCKESEALDLPIDTSVLRDGEHTLKVTVTDAAQNTSVVYDGTISTHNAPVNIATPAITAAGGQLLPGTVLAAQPGEWSAPNGAGALTYGYRWEDCDPQGNGCAVIAGADGSDYAALPGDVGHTLRVLVDSSNSDGTATTASEPSAVVSAAQGALGVAGATFTAGVPGAPNGTDASEGAHLRLAGPTAIARSFARRAFTLTGQVQSETGAAIAGATLEIHQQTQGTSTASSIGYARSDANGTFSVRIPPGPSRTVSIGYRAFSTDTGYSVQAALRETVAAGVRLGVTPHRTGSLGSIVLSGSVAGPVPRSGVVVEMLVHYRGQWQPFRDPHTDAAGRFRVRYRFEGALGRFPFRAEIIGGQAGFPYATGESPPVEVATG